MVITSPAYHCRLMTRGLKTQTSKDESPGISQLDYENDKSIMRSICLPPAVELTFAFIAPLEHAAAVIAGVSESTHCVLLSALNQLMCKLD